MVDACAQLETAVEADNWPRIHHLLLGLDGLLLNIKTSAEAYLKAHEASCV